MFGPASIMSLHTGNYTGGVVEVVNHKSEVAGTASPPTSGSKYAGFGWGGGGGPLNETTASIVRDIIMGGDAHGKYANTAKLDSSLEADAVYIRLFDWAVMRHVAAGTKDAAMDSPKPTNNPVAFVKRFIGKSKKKLVDFKSKLGSGGSESASDSLSVSTASTVDRSASYGGATDYAFPHDAMSPVCRDLIVLLCSGLMGVGAEEVCDWWSPLHAKIYAQVKA
jgi:hypothetical protein